MLSFVFFVRAAAHSGVFSNVFHIFPLMDVHSVPHAQSMSSFIVLRYSYVVADRRSLVRLRSTRHTLSHQTKLLAVILLLPLHTPPPSFTYVMVPSWNPRQPF